MPTTIIESGTAGPAYSAATWPVMTKIPAPMTAPIPSATRFTGPSARTSEWSPAAAASARNTEMDLVANRLIRPMWEPPPVRTTAWGRAGRSGDERALPLGVNHVVAEATAQGEARSRVQDHHGVAVKPGLDFAHAIDVDERRAADAAELPGVEPLFERGEGRPQHVRAVADVEPDVVPRRFDPIDLGRLDERAASVLLHQQPVAGSFRGDARFEISERGAPLLEVAVIRQ